MSVLELEPTLLEVLRTLGEHDVEFVVVGDVAAAIHNNGGSVSGLAVVPGAYGRNAERLGGALQALNAEPGIAGTRFDHRRMDLREIAPCSFITGGVDIDVNFQPPGTRGYRDLFDDADTVQLARGVRPLVAARVDLERIARNSAPAVPHARAPGVLPREPGHENWATAQIRAGRPTRI